MTDLYLYNTLSHKKEIFKPLNPEKIGMYVCGPTVYDHPHIGNARSFVIYDLLYRILRTIYGKEQVEYVRNITDVDDKINARAKKLGISIGELTKKTTEEFHKDTAYLHCLEPNIEPRATDNIAGMISIIENLLTSNHAYTSNYHVYFDVTSYPDYGRLSGRKLDAMMAGARVEIEQAKRHPGDFVLWKPADLDDDPSSIFESPWGVGRPGWHIECSAMSYRYLGKNFDIHGGGADLIFPHHTNEIAQSCCGFSESKFASYWVHNGFLTVSGEKMSKSLDNFITVHDLREKKIKGEVIRYLLLSTHYRKPLDFSDKAIYDATESLNYLYRAIEDVELIPTSPDPKFVSFLVDDMNTSEAFSYLHEKAKELNKTADQLKQKTLACQIKASANMVGLLQTTSDAWFTEGLDAKQVEALIAARKVAKDQKDWAEADRLRKTLSAMGVILEDNPDGTSSWRVI